MLIISPFEANQLQARVRASIAVRMHLYAPRQIQGYSSLDSLTLYTVPGRSSILEICYSDYSSTYLQDSYTSDHTMNIVRYVTSLAWRLATPPSN